MEIEIRYFASLAERTGLKIERVELDVSSDVADLWRLLIERHPSLSGLSYRPLAACDRVYADWNRKLEGVCEVAFLPPVSGG